MKQELNRYDILNKIMPLVENTAMRFNFIPIEVDFTKENHKWYLRIFLFSYERAITLDDCENYTKSINDFLDELIPCKYYLEVSSPGLERKLKSNKEYLIFKGKNISIKLKEPIEGENEKIFKAIIIGYTENEGIKILRLDDNKEIDLKFEQINNSRLYLE